jgi:leucine dehydrogenase
MDRIDAPPPFDTLEDTGLSRAIFLSDAPSGLRAIIAIDDLTLGPAAGGVRTLAYPSVAAALCDASALSRAMTLKCALGGLDAGGGKAVVLDHEGLDRERAFEILGTRIEELGGLFRTAGDLGTHAVDLDAMARTTQYVHTEEVDLTAAVARGLLRCVEAVCDKKGVEVEGVRVAVQDVGAIGAAVCRALADAGAALTIADIDKERAEALAALVGARTVSPDVILFEDVDVLCPCAVGGVLTEASLAEIRAWGIVPGANNVLSGGAVGWAIHRRGILFVPDVIASAGAVVDGIGRTVMHLSDRTLLIDRLGETAREVLARADVRDRPATEVATAIAMERIGKALGLR